MIMIIIYFILVNLFKATNFGYNKAMMGGRTFNSHYIQTSVFPNQQQRQQQNIQRKQLVTQSTVRPTQINYYSNMFQNIQKKKRKPKNNLVIFDSSGKQKNLLTLQKLIEQQQKYQINDKKPSLNEVLIKKPLNLNKQVEVQDPIRQELESQKTIEPQKKEEVNMLDILQQLQDEEENSLQTQLPIKEEKKEPKISFENQEQNSIMQQLFQQQEEVQEQEMSMMDQIAQMNPQKEKQALEKPPDFQMQDFDFNQFSETQNLSELQGTEKQPFGQRPDQFSQQKQFNQDINNKSNPFSKNDQNLQKQQQINPRQQSESNPFENIDDKMKQKPEKINLNEFQQTKDFSSKSNSNNSNPFNQSKKDQLQNQPPQNNHSSKFSNLPNGPSQEDNQTFKRPQQPQEDKFQPPKSKPQENKPTNEKPNLFSMLSFEELMALRGIGNDKVSNDESVSFVELDSIGSNKLKGGNKDRGINSLFGPSSDPEPPKPRSPPPRQNQPKKQTRQFKPPTFITDEPSNPPQQSTPQSTRDFKPPTFITEEPQQQSSKSEYIPSNRPDDPFAGFNQEQEQETQPQKKQEKEEPFFDPFAEFNKEQEEKNKPKKKNNEPENPFD